MEWIKSNNRKNDTSYTEKYQNHVLCSFAYKVIGIADKFSKSVVLYREKNTVDKFIEAIFREQKIIKKHFNKNLIMCAKDEERFQSSNKCWICNKLFRYLFKIIK